MRQSLRQAPFKFFSSPLDFLQPGEAARLVVEKSAAHEKIALAKMSEQKERKERDQKAREERRRKKEEEERKKEEEQPKIQELTDEEAERLQKEIDSKTVSPQCSWELENLFPVLPSFLPLFFVLPSSSNFHFFPPLPYLPAGSVRKRKWRRVGLRVHQRRRRQNRRRRRRGRG